MSSTVYTDLIGNISNPPTASELSNAYLNVYKYATKLDIKNDRAWIKDMKETLEDVVQKYVSDVSDETTQEKREKAIRNILKPLSQKVDICKMALDDWDNMHKKPTNSYFA